MAIPPNTPVLTRREAKERGLSKYWNGKPCHRNHQNFRYTATGACVSCIRLYNGKVGGSSINSELHRLGFSLMHFMVHPDDEAEIRAFIAKKQTARMRPAFDPVEEDAKTRVTKRAMEWIVKPWDQVKPGEDNKPRQRDPGLLGDPMRFDEAVKMEMKRMVMEDRIITALSNGWETINIGEDHFNTVAAAKEWGIL